MLVLLVGLVPLIAGALSSIPYLGIGAQEPTASWGSIFYDGATTLTDHWWITVFPGAAIVITVLAFNSLGDALRDVLDPRQLHVARRLPGSHPEERRDEGSTLPVERSIRIPDSSLRSE